MNPPENSPNGPPLPLRRSLLPRLVAAILLVSGAATLMATGVQLWIEYREDVAEIHDDIQAIRDSYVEPITTAIWLFNEELVQQHLRGIAQMQDITYIRVRDENGTVAEAGRPVEKGRTITAEFPLVFPYEGQLRNLGQLQVEVDLQGVHNRLRRRVLVVLATQGVKTLVVSAFLFLLFHLLVTRHLRTIAKYLGAVDASRPFAPLRLKRGPLDRTPGDEFDRLMESLNNMLWLLALRREDLEKRVAARTAELDRANRALREKIETLERIEAALRESEERFVAFMANTPTLTFIKDGMGRHLFVNRFFEERYGLTARSDWENKTDFALFPLHTAVNFRRNDLRVILEGRPLDFEETFVRPDGTREFWVTYKFPIPAPDGRRFVGAIAIDFTEKRLMEIELMHARKRETVEVLAGGLAHDFNNLLTVILGNIGLVKEEMDPGGANHRFLDEAERACLRSQKLTDLLITFAKGGQPARLPGDIGAAAREAVAAASAGTSVRTELHLPKDLWRVEFDPEAMREVFSRLAINAREAMPQGGVLRVSGKNLESFPGEGNGAADPPGRPFVYLCFADTGRGIPPERIDLVFDPYFSTKERGAERGMGMGLAVASAIIRKHDGHISVTSTPGQGATFHLHLPATLEKAAPLPAAKPLLPNRRGRRILVMDDEKMVCRMLVQMLSRLDFEAECAHDGAAAVKVYREAMEADNPFAAVILDLTVRGGPGGLAAIPQLRQIDPDVAAVVSSGYSDEPAMADPESHGFRASIPKPYTMEKLREVLQGLVGVDSAPMP